MALLLCSAKDPPKTRNSPNPTKGDLKTLSPEIRTKTTDKEARVAEEASLTREIKTSPRYSVMVEDNPF